MTDIVTRDDRPFSSTTGNSADDLESITDVTVLQEMLEQSEDLEFRRLVRAQLRKLKKGIQENEPTSKPIKTTEHRFVPQSTTNGGGVDLKSAGSNLRKTSNTSSSPHSMKSPLTDTNQSGARLSEVKLRSTSVSKGNEDANRTNGFKMEEVVLRSTPRISPCPSSGDKKGKPAYDVTLKHVTSAGGSSGGVGSGSRSTVTSGGLLRSKGNPTPRQALKHFKEMDNEALLRVAGTSDPSDALKRMSRNLSPNTIRDQTLNWCKNRLYSYENINIEDFSSSWNDGLAFCALANSFFPQAFDYDSLTAEDRGRNFKLAFDTLEREAGVVPLLEVEDMVSTRNPDWKCVFTYVNSIIARMSEIRKEKQEEEERKLRNSLLLSYED